MKKKPLRANHVTYITKALTKAIMKRSELESKYLKNKTSEKFRNLTKNKEMSAVNYIKKKKKYYERLDLNNVTDKKKFWKIVKSFFQKMPQVENDEIISDKSKVTNSFSNFFENAIHSLGVKTNEYSNDNYGLKNPVEIAIKKYQQHPSINLTKENITKNEGFYFLPTEQESILKVIINLDNKKKGTFKNIPTRHLKDVSDICSPILANSWNEGILLNKNFPENLKLADTLSAQTQSDLSD